MTQIALFSSGNGTNAESYLYTDLKNTDLKTDLKNHSGEISPVDNFLSLFTTQSREVSPHRPVTGNSPIGGSYVTLPESTPLPKVTRYVFFRSSYQLPDSACG